MRHIRWAILAALLLLAVSGCQFSGRALVDADQPSWEGGSIVAVEPGHPVGQTFVARHGGLTGIEFLLVPSSSHIQSVTLHVRAEPQEPADLATVTLQLPAGAEAAFYRFRFSPLAASHIQYYYAFLEVSEPGVAVALGSGKAYLDGSAHRGHHPLDAQTAFQLVYAPGHVALDLFGAVWGWLGILGASALLFVVPGWALLAWCWSGRQLSWAETLGLAAGLSLALYPLLFLWTDLVGLHLGGGYAWLPAVAGAIALLWRYRSRLATVVRKRPAKLAKEKTLQWLRSDAFWFNVILIVLLSLVFGVRLMVVRSLDAPMWGDSHQHTIIAQLLVDNGGLFDSWAPYAPYDSLTVHYGFHSLVAAFSWLTGMEVLEATTLVGQVVNGLAVVSLYPLAVRLANGRRWAGVGAVLVAGLLSPMPAFYVNWGRYSQLAGQAILPGTVWLTLVAAQSDLWRRRLILLAGFSLAGMALSYYRMPLFYAPLVVMWLLIEGISSWGRRMELWFGGMARLALVAVVAAILLLPWVAHIVGSHLSTALAAGISNQSPLQAVLSEYQAWMEILFYVPRPLLVAALLGLVWALVRRQWTVAAVALWALSLASWVAGRLIGLPAANMMQSFAVLIALYIPVALLVGWLVGALAEWILQHSRTAGAFLGGTVLAILMLGGAIRQTSIVQSSFIMVTRPDLQAMAWIRDNTPGGSLFLVEGFLIYDGYSAVGADAGWWIPLLAGRENTMPPQYAMLNERPSDPSYTKGVIKLVSDLQTASPASPEGLEVLCKWGISHIYVGQGQGDVGAGVTQLFSPEMLANAPYLDLVYHRDRVYIFGLDSQACDQSR